MGRLRRALPRMLLHALLVAIPSLGALALECRPAVATGDQDIGHDLRYAKRRAILGPRGEGLTAHLALFGSRAFRLRVVDLGAGPEPAYATLADALRAHGCVAGVNGGFFHPDLRPAGLVIAAGHRINRLETARLLSGVLYGDDRGLHLTRRSRFRDHAGIDALLQGGPYLVEDGLATRGLSAADPNRRTFVATDRRGHWVLGATESRVTLAELADCLAAPGALTPWRVDRALNLDGGSSTGFFFAGEDGRAPLSLEPWKRVRNLVGIVPR